MLSSKPGRAPAPLGPQQCFLAINLCRSAQNLPPVTDALLVPDAVPFLSGAAAQAWGIERENVLAPTHFRVTVSAADAGCPVEVYAGPRRLPSGGEPRAKDFLALGVLPRVTPDGVDITPLLLKRRWAVAPGYVVWLRLVPLTVNGFRGQPVTVSATVGVLP